jgi:hypothetical protein
MDRLTKEKQMSQKAPTLQSTKEYSRFELCQFNRNIQKTKFLKESMQKHGFIPAYPIHCERGPGNRLRIKAGHHRFEVAQELGISVYYVISDDSAGIAELEWATNKWTIKNYLESYSRCGMADYVKLAEYVERTQIPLSLAISMLGGECASSGNLLNRFKLGKFVITGEAHAEMVADIVLFCSRKGIRSRDVIFIQSLSRCLFTPEFNAESFKAKAKINVAMFKPCRSVAEQTAIFEAVYNMKTRADNRMPLAFMVSKAMAARSISSKKKGT